MLAGEFEQDTDDFVFHPAEAFSAAPAVSILQQQLLGFGTSVVQRNLEPLCDQQTQVALVARVGLGKLLQLRSDCAYVDELARSA